MRVVSSARGFDMQRSRTLALALVAALAGTALAGIATNGLVEVESAAKAAVAKLGKAAKLGLVKIENRTVGSLDPKLDAKLKEVVAAAKDVTIEEQVDKADTLVVTQLSDFAADGKFVRLCHVELVDASTRAVLAITSAEGAGPETLGHGATVELADVRALAKDLETKLGAYAGPEKSPRARVVVSNLTSGHLDSSVVAAELMTAMLASGKVIPVEDRNFEGETRGVKDATVAADWVVSCKLKEQRMGGGGKAVSVLDLTADITPVRGGRKPVLSAAIQVQRER
jgi:hypothetical protein